MGGIRTHTELVLSEVSLPIGLPCELFALAETPGLGPGEALDPTA